MAALGAVLAVRLGGAVICTMLPHFGHAKICPIAAALRTVSRDWHVTQVILNGSTQ
jgi:hypothetical protein